MRQAEAAATMRKYNQTATKTDKAKCVATQHDTKFIKEKKEKPHPTRAHENRITKATLTYKDKRQGKTAAKRDVTAAC